MANTKEIQDRIKSINDTLKITNAMYMISSSKLKKSKKMLADTEPYFFTLQSEMSRILRHLPDMEDIYFKTNEDKLPEDRKVGYIVITADKGPAGSYNHNILKMAEEHLKDHPNHSLFVLGELGRHYFEQRGIEIEKQFHYTVQNPTLNRARNIAEEIAAKTSSQVVQVIGGAMIFYKENPELRAEQEKKQQKEKELNSQKEQMEFLPQEVQEQIKKRISRNRKS